MKIFNIILLVGASLSMTFSIQDGIKLSDTKIEVEADQPQTKESIKISELVNNKTKYNGKEVLITGKCTKINANIMGRNWIHLKDGSKDDFDLVITSSDVVKEGETVTMSGIVVLEKDFGAGYKYDLIIELGKVIEDNN